MVAEESASIEGLVLRVVQIPQGPLHIQCIREAPLGLRSLAHTGNH